MSINVIDTRRIDTIVTFAKQYCMILNLFQALISLFVLASKDGWVSIMYTGLDAVGVDQQVTSI